MSAEITRFLSDRHRLGQFWNISDQTLVQIGPNFPNYSCFKNMLNWKDESLNFHLQGEGFQNLITFSFYTRFFADRGRVFYYNFHVL